jgi:Trp operon repressor
MKRLLCSHTKVINQRTEDFVWFVVPIDEQQQKKVSGHYLPMLLMFDEEMSVYKRPL